MIRFFHRRSGHRSRDWLRVAQLLAAIFLTATSAVTPATSQEPTPPPGEEIIPADDWIIEDGETSGGQSDFLITTGKSYNRVEGLPVAFGPRIWTAGANPFRLEALAVYRTESGLKVDPEEMGYFVRADQYVGGLREFRIGAQLYSVVDPIEEWQMTDLESGLSTFVFHRDQRDHYERTGWALTAGWEPANLPLTVTVERRQEKHSSRASGAPWALFRNADPWRPQPLAAEGEIASVVGQLNLDTRVNDWNPAAGWLILARLEHAWNVDLFRPSIALFDPASTEEIPATPHYNPFLDAFVDVRSYHRINATSRLNLRVVGGASLTGEPLPAQRQHALGGDGSLPAYPQFSGDCGARAVTVTPSSQAGTDEAIPFYPAYGCDAFGLVQAEFRGKLNLRIRWDGGPWDGGSPGGDEEESVAVGWASSPDWSIFVDAGRGWSFHDGLPDERVRVDVGAGLMLERFGVYFAVPVASGSGVNLFVRLGPRF
jgi:hypothetical protein